MLEHDY